MKHFIKYSINTKLVPQIYRVITKCCNNDDIFGNLMKKPGCQDILLPPCTYIPFCSMKTKSCKI